MGFIDFFAKEFPNQFVGLEISTPIKGMKDEFERIFEFGVEKYPDQLFLQSNQLHGRNNNQQMFAYKILLKYKDKITNGFQNLAGWKYEKSTERQGDFEQTIRNFKFANAEYYELWYGDGQNAELCKKIQNSIWMQK